MRKILFTLVVDNFGVKYVNQDNITHLIQCIKQHYEVMEDWSGDLYCGIKLDWNYDACTLDILMPGYIKKLLLKCKHCMSNQSQHCLYLPSPKQYDAQAQTPLPVDISPRLSPEEIKEIQRIIGSILYYVRATDIAVFMALSSIAIKQTKDDKYNSKSKATFGLPHHQPQRNHTVPSLRHDYESAFGRILPIQIQHAKPRLWTLFHGLECKGW
jgi:hypothetical protein